MDILFDGVAIDCSSDQFEAASVCSALGNERAIKTVNDTHLSFSVLGGVSCINDNVDRKLIKSIIYALKWNATSIGRFEVYRGIKDTMQLGEVTKLNGEEEVDVWEGDCNKIIGTDSTM